VLGSKGGPTDPKRFAGPSRTWVTLRFCCGGPVGLGWLAQGRRLPLFCDPRLSVRDFWSLGDNRRVSHHSFGISDNRGRRKTPRRKTAYINIYVPGVKKKRRQRIIFRRRVLKKKSPLQTGPLRWGRERAAAFYRTVACPRLLRTAASLPGLCVEVLDYSTGNRRSKSGRVAKDPAGAIDFPAAALVSVFLAKVSRALFCARADRSLPLPGTNTERTASPARVFSRGREADFG